MVGADDAVAAALFRTNFQVMLGGSLFVADIEVGDRVRRLSDPKDAPAFLDLDFPEAREHFLSRRVLDPEEFYSLEDAERFRSFTLARDTGEGLASLVKARLDAAMRPGGVGLQEFIGQFTGAIEGAFESDIDPRAAAARYLENVYRTTTATSYGAGRFKMQTDPDVAAALPFWEYLTAEDSRVRDEHIPLHGKVWRVGDPEGVAVYPPNGYQCRCVAVSVAEDEIDRDQLERAVDWRTAIQDGFSGSPMGTIEKEAGV